MMRASTITRWALGLVATILLTGCPPERPSDRTANRVEVRKGQSSGESEPVAIVNGEVLTRAEFERRIEVLPPLAKSRFADDQARRDFLDDQVQFEVLADLAESKGYADRPEVRYFIKDAMVRQMLRDEVNRRFSPSDISEAEIQKEYEANRAEFERPASRRVALIPLDAEKTATRIREQIVEAQENAESRVNIVRQFAARNGVEAQIAKNGGDIGWVDEPSHRANKNTGRNKVVAEKVFAIEEAGTVSEPFEVEGRWYLATFFDERPEKTRAFADVAEEIRDRLYNARKASVRSEVLAEWTKDARIEINEDVLKSIPKPDTVAPPVPDILKPKAPVRDLKGPRGADKGDEPEKEAP